MEGDFIAQLMLLLLGPWEGKRGKEEGYSDLFEEVAKVENKEQVGGKQPIYMYYFPHLPLLI